MLVHDHIVYDFTAAPVNPSYALMIILHEYSACFRDTFASTSNIVLQPLQSDVVLMIYIADISAQDPNANHFIRSH